MKTRSLLTVLCSIFLVIGMVGAAGAELITNGDFGDQLAGWSPFRDADVKVLIAGDPDRKAVLGINQLPGTPTGTAPYQYTGLIYQQFSLPVLGAGSSLKISFDYFFRDTDGIIGDDRFFVRFIQLNAAGTNLGSTLILSNGTADSVYDPADAKNNWDPILFSTNVAIRENAVSARLAFYVLETAAAGETDSNIWRTYAAVDNVSVNPVPEPATMLLLGSGLIGLAGFGRRKLFKK